MRLRIYGDNMNNSSFLSTHIARKQRVRGWCWGPLGTDPSPPLLRADAIERFLGRHRLTIAVKLTGLILAALSAQMVFTGIRNILPA